MSSDKSGVDGSWSDLQESSTDFVEDYTVSVPFLEPDGMFSADPLGLSQDLAQASHIQRANDIKLAVHQDQMEYCSEDATLLRKFVLESQELYNKKNKVSGSEVGSREGFSGNLEFLWNDRDYVVPLERCVYELMTRLLNQEVTVHIIPFAYESIVRTYFDSFNLKVLNELRLKFVSKTYYKHVASGPALKFDWNFEFIGLPVDVLPEVVDLTKLYFHLVLGPIIISQIPFKKRIVSLCNSRYHYAK